MKISIGYSPEKGKPETEVVIEVCSEWSPKGAERFLQMIQDGLFDGCKMHRVVPGFIVQFGIAADPEKQAKWQHTIKDDPPGVTNGTGTICFARRGPDTRSTQVFINLNDNPDLDSQGFTPFGRVVKGFEAIAASYAGYAKNPKPDASIIKAEGNAYLDANFPKLGTFGKARAL